MGVTKDRRGEVSMTPKAWKFGESILAVHGCIFAWSLCRTGVIRATETRCTYRRNRVRKIGWRVEKITSTAIVKLELSASRDCVYVKFVIPFVSRWSIILLGIIWTRKLPTHHSSTLGFHFRSSFIVHSSKNFMVNRQASMALVLASRGKK